MFKILGAKNRQKNLHKHPGPPFQIREGPDSFCNAHKWLVYSFSILFFLVSKYEIENRQQRPVVILQILIKVNDKNKLFIQDNRFENLKI